MNAIELLVKDHEEVKDLIEQLEGADELSVDSGTNGLFQKLKQALTLHTHLEEQAFYPVMRGFAETREMIEEAVKEHQEVDDLLAEMTDLQPHGDEFQEKLTELREALEHHIEEEENELFPKSEDLCGEKRLEEIGRQMEEMKKSKRATVTASRK